MGIKQLYNDNLRKLPNEYGDVSVMGELLEFDISDVVWIYFRCPDKLFIIFCQYFG